MIRRASQAELETLASACGVVPFYNTGEPWTERANVYAWGDPIEGCFIMDPIDAKCAEVHVVVHPDHRGRRAYEMGRLFLGFVRSSGMSMVAIIPKVRRHALSYALRSGMVLAGETHDEWFAYGG